MYKHIDPTQLQALLAADDPPLMIDVRSVAEVARGTIMGARHLELATLPSRVDELDAAAPIVVFCLSGGRSAQACNWLAQRGFSNLYNLDGGIAAWTRAGMPVTA
jgi:rhodanese-related sulfurtransferase